MLTYTNELDNLGFSHKDKNPWAPPHSSFTAISVLFYIFILSIFERNCYIP